MGIIKEEAWQEALKLNAEPAQLSQGHLAVHLTWEEIRQHKREKVWCMHFQVETC